MRAPVAQLDRALASEAKGRGFDSRRARQMKYLLRLLQGESGIKIFEQHPGQNLALSIKIRIRARSSAG